MNSIELMSSRSTRSGTFPLRIAVASFVVYWASGTGVRSMCSRSWLLWKRSTTTCTPPAVAARHHIVTVPPAVCPNPAECTSGSGRIPVPQAGRAAARPATAESRRNSRRVSAISPPPQGSHRRSAPGQPHPHRPDPAVRPGEVRDRGNVDGAGRGGNRLAGRPVRPAPRHVGADLAADRDDGDAAEQVRPVLGGRGGGGGPRTGGGRGRVPPGGP